MYNFTDIIKNKFLEEFTAISIGQLVVALLLSFVLGLFIVFIYKLTYKGVMYSAGFAMGLVLLCMVTALVILTISSNIVLSLGMVGALSIVRFRTAVKDALDTIFMFWAIVTGIAAGAGFVTVAVIATLMVGLLFVVLSMGGRLFTSKAYLVVARCEGKAPDSLMSALPGCRMKSRTIRDGAEELVLEAKLTQQQLTKVRGLASMDGVLELSVLEYNGASIL